MEEPGCAALDAAAVALADAGIPMRDMVSACAAGKVADTVVLDVNNEEDQAGQGGRYADGIHAEPKPDYTVTA